MLKRFANALAAVAAWPLVGSYRLKCALVPARRIEAFQAAGQLLSLLPGLTGDYVRRAFYRRALARCAGSCVIKHGTLLTHPGTSLGEHVYIGTRCTIGYAAIGDDVLIGSNVDIVSGRHQHTFERLDTPIRLQGGRYDRVTIGRDSWIGNGACVTADVGEQAIVAAGAVVVKPVLPRTIVGGNPARQIAERVAGGAGELALQPSAELP